MCLNKHCNFIISLFLDQAHGKNNDYSIKSLKYLLIAVLLLVFIIFLIYIVRSGFLGTKLSRVNKNGETSKPPGARKNVSPKKDVNSIRQLMNKHDKSISDVLQKANKLFDQGKIEQALREFTFLSSKYPKSPFARFNKAQALDKKAHQMRSNELLMEAGKLFHEVADIEDCPAELKKVTLKRHADVLSFLGRYMSAARSLEKVAALFPKDFEIHRSIGVQYLMAGKTEKALEPFKMVSVDKLMVDMLYK